MSPRTLHFSSDRITWECQARILTEYLADGVASDQRGGFDCLYQESYTVEDFGGRGDLSNFYRLVFAYTGRQLSYPAEDKLVAFAAVARRCGPWFGGEYCAGIYRNSMPWDLVWEASFNPHKKRSGKYRAPTWSWASLDVCVRLNPNIWAGEASDMVDIKDVSVQLVDPTNEFGPVTAASLTLTGSLAPPA
ncbi:hypothetical protein ACJ41O_006233 [Fusarium nematophilum]